MGDAEKVLDAVSAGPLPVHVVRQRTGIDGDAISGTLRELQSQGKIVRAGEMVGLPEPGYIPNPPAVAGPGDASFTATETDEWDALDPTMVMGPDVPVGEPVDAEVQEQFLVATAYQLVTAVDAQRAADQALGGMGTSPGKDEVLVVPVADAQVYERATVVRPKRP